MNKKGAVLIIVITFLLVAAITSVGLYNAVYLAGKTQGIDEVKRTRGYYAAAAGVEYASVILRSVNLPKTGNSVTKTIKRGTMEEYDQLAHDLGLAGSESVIVIITRRSDGQYDVISTFKF